MTREREVAKTLQKLHGQRKQIENRVFVEERFGSRRVRGGEDIHICSTTFTTYTHILHTHLLHILLHTFALLLHTFALYHAYKIPLHTSTNLSFLSFYAQIIPCLYIHIRSPLYLILIPLCLFTSCFRLLFLIWIQSK